MMSKADEKPDEPKELNEMTEDDYKADDLSEDAILEHDSLEMERMGNILDEQRKAGSAETKGVLHDTEKDKVVATPSPIKEQSGGCCNHLSEMSGKVYNIPTKNGEKVYNKEPTKRLYLVDSIRKLPDNWTEITPDFENEIISKIYRISTMLNQGEMSIEEIVREVFRQLRGDLK